MKLVDISRQYDSPFRFTFSIIQYLDPPPPPPQNTPRLPPKFCKVSVLKCSWEEEAFENFTTYNSQRFHLSS